MCLNKEHWNNYSPDCYECDKEMKSVLHNEALTLEEYELWKNKKLSIGINHMSRINS